jgi:C1A family cysteine protease
MADQPLDHTIFLVGWTVDEKTKMPVWIVRNSYGDAWGMKGDFLVRRGQDDWGLESELSSYIVELMQ